MYGDFHMHSTASDGRFAPSELMEHCHKHALSAVALTDHDTVAGCGEAAAAAERLGMIFIPGIEVSSFASAVVPRYELGVKAELHILGLGVDPAAHALQELTSTLISKRMHRAQRMCTLITRHFQLDPPLRLEDVYAAVGRCAGDTLGRPHFARVLVQRDLANNMSDAFDRFLGNGKPCYAAGSAEYTPAADAIQAIHAAGGVAVWAHPHLTLGDRPQRCYEEYLDVLCGLGLDGVEVAHSGAPSARHTAMLETLAKERALVCTHGSDFHDVLRGPIGEPRRPAEVADQIMAAAQRVRKGMIH